MNQRMGGDKPPGRGGRGWMLAALIGVLSACSSTPPAVAPAASSPEPVAAASDGSAVAANRTRAGRAAASSLPAHLDPAHPISDKRSVYFDLNDYALPPEAVALLQLHGMYLVANPQIAIRIEGHTDELGGAEYNLALGQRRADAVANALKVMGVQDTQLEAVSYGEEKPRALGHDEDAWAENRRADLIYPGQ